MTKSIWLVLTCSFLLLFGTFPLDSAEAVTKGNMTYMVTSFINNSQLIQGHSISYDIHVAKIDSSKPKETIMDANNATVYVYFKKGNKLVKNVLKTGDKGIYHGDVTLNETGEWQVMIIATDGAPAESVTSEGPDTLHTTWNVEAPSLLYFWYWFIGILVLAVIVILFFVQRKKR